MLRNLSILAALIVIVALPFIFRQKESAGAWKEGDPQLVIISPHNEAIRYEFEHGFSRWHHEKYGQPVKISWRNIGGTSEISRYLQGEYATASKSWWTAQKKDWPIGATDAVVAARPPAPADQPPPEITKENIPAWSANQEQVIAAYRAYRGVDDTTQITSKVDLFFGGGQFDHSEAFSRGFAVEPWPSDKVPESVQPSLALIPDRLAGEIWRTPTLFGTAISTFGIVYNVDRLKDLGVTTPPTSWDDLGDFRYVGQVGVTDPTKSGSIAKAFEMLVHSKMKSAVAKHLLASGVAVDQIDQTIDANEKRIDAHQKTKTADGKSRPKWDVPDDLVDYQSALEAGWLDAMYLIQAIGGNARYFTDSATKVSIDVSIGDAAVGMSIDFYGRYQSQMSAAPDGTSRMEFVTPIGGTSVSCDPISLLRGAPHRELAVRFIEYTLSEEGQRLWTYKPGVKDAAGEPEGTIKYALRRLPIRRDFYPSTQPAIDAAARSHLAHASDDLANPDIDPYQVATHFTYYPRWTGSHFGIMREIVRAMCLDSGIELREAWKRAHQDKFNEERLAKIHQLPTVRLHPKASKDGQAVEVPLNWRTAQTFRDYEPLEYMREWTRAFRDQYRKAGATH